MKCILDNCSRAADGICPEPIGYRIRSDGPIRGALWPAPGACECEIEYRCMAVSIAAKSRTEPGSAIQVVHVKSGEVIYQKPPEPLRENLFAA